MRVLAITNLFPNPWQPHRATFNRQQFEALAKLHEVRVIAPVAWTHELTAKWKGQSAEHEMVAASADSSARKMKVKHPRYLFPPRMLRGWHGHCLKRSIEADFRRAVNEFRPEVVLGAWAYPDGWAAVELAHAAGLPVAIKVHGSDVLLPKPGSARRQRTIEALQRADAVIAVSRHLADEMIAFGIDSTKIRVVYNGVDGELFSPGSRLESRQRLVIGDGNAGKKKDGDSHTDGNDEALPLLLYVGNLVHVKGPDILIDACRLLAARQVRFECCLIGQGAIKPLLQKKIRQWNLGEHVRLLGPRALEQMPDWYRSATVLVVPSRSEGLPNVVLEALACGTPVVASNVGGVAEVKGLDVQSIVPPNDATALAEAIERQIHAGERAVKWRSPRASWTNSAQSLSRALEKLAGNWSGVRSRAA